MVHFMEGFLVVRSPRSFCTLRGAIIQPHQQDVPVFNKDLK